MPVEIKELVIKAVVNESGMESSQSEPSVVSTYQKTDLIDECVKQVLKILRQAKER